MPIGVGELLLVLVIILVIFGAGKLPQVMNDLGKGVKSLKKGLKDDAEEDNLVKNKKKLAKSVEKAIAAIDVGKFKDEIVPVTVHENYYEEGKMKSREFVVDTDEGPRRGTTAEGLAKLRPAFAADGTSTAGNSSQMSDGAAFVLVVSEKIVKEYNLEPIARLVDYQVAGVEPYKMGIGPVAAIPKVLNHAGLKLQDVDLIELNEAFASQSIAVINELGIDANKVNVNGGAIALGHPLGATGAKLTVQILHELKKTNGKYGMVTMCIGTGQGAAGIFEML